MEHGGLYWPSSPKKKLFILALDQWEGVEHFRGISE